MCVRKSLVSQHLQIFLKAVSTHPQKHLTSVRLLLTIVGEVSESTDVTDSDCVWHFPGAGHIPSVFERGP